MSANPRHVTRKERLICETRPVQSSFRYGRVDPSNPDPCAGASVRVVFRGQYPPEFALALRVTFLSVVAHSPVVASASNNQYFNMKSNQKTKLLVKLYDFLQYGGHNTGCVRLASLGLPRGAHSGEPLTRAKRTTTHRSRSDVVYLGPAPK